MSVNSNEVRTGYDRWAQVYDRDGNPLIGLEEPVVHRLAGDVRGQTVLDVGCGTGRHSLWLAAAGASVTAIDFSPGMLEQAGQKPGAEKIRFLVHDLRQPLPFDDRSFDLVISGLVLEHIENLPPLFLQIHRVLRRGSRAVLSAMHPAMMLRGTAARFTDPISGQVVQPGSYPHQISDFVMAALRADFQIEELGEFITDANLAARFPRAEKYIGWPMLVTLALRA